MVAKRVVQIWTDEDGDIWLTVFFAKGIQLCVLLTEEDLKNLRKDTTDLLDARE